MGQQIKVTIERDVNIYLVFAFENQIKLNLSSDKTEDTQKFFLDLLQELIRKKVKSLFY